MHYTRISRRTGFCESIDIDTGRLVKITLVTDSEKISTYTVRAKNGKVMVSGMIPEPEVAYLARENISYFMPNNPAVRDEICYLVAEGASLDSLGRDFPPTHVINMWASDNADFKKALLEARRVAARVKFDKALNIALKNEDDPKALKTIVDILKRHAEVDDADTFQVKSKESEPLPANIHISFNTGVPDKVVEVIQLESDSTSTD